VARRGLTQAFEHGWRHTGLRDGVDERLIPRHQFLAALELHLAHGPLNHEKGEEQAEERPANREKRHENLPKKLRCLKSHPSDGMPPRRRAVCSTAQRISRR
jgi:hypothetical protein